MLIQDLIPGFQRYLLFEKNLSPSYVKGVLDTVRLLFRYDESLRVSQCTTDHIRSFLYQMREDRLWSPKTLRNYRNNLKIYFQFALRKQHIRKNPVDEIGVPKLSKSLPRCLTKSQTEVLISEVHCYPWKYRLEGYRNVAIFYTFLFAGLRLSELLNLQMHQVNFEEAHFFIENGKGRKDRYVPIHPSLVPVLKCYQSKRAEKLASSPYFFTSIRSSKPLTKKNIYAIFQKLSLKCGFKIRPHLLRHTMAKLSLEADLNPYKLKEILGHSNIATTQIYMSVSTQNIRQSFSKIKLL